MPYQALKLVKRFIDTKENRPVGTVNILVEDIPKRCALSEDEICTLETNVKSRMLWPLGQTHCNGH
jgi:hypothetical protein